MQHFVLRSLKNPFSRARRTNEWRDRHSLVEVVVVLLNRGERRVLMIRRVGLGVSRGIKYAGRTDDGPTLKEYMSSTRSLGLFWVGDIRSIV